MKGNTEKLSQFVSKIRSISKRIRSMVINHPLYLTLQQLHYYHLNIPSIQTFLSSLVGILLVVVSFLSFTLAHNNKEVAFFTTPKPENIYWLWSLDPNTNISETELSEIFDSSGDPLRLQNPGYIAFEYDGKVINYSGFLPAYHELSPISVDENSLKGSFSLENQSQVEACNFIPSPVFKAPSEAIFGTLDAQYLDISLIQENTNITITQKVPQVVLDEGQSCFNLRISGLTNFFAIPQEFGFRVDGIHSANSQLSPVNIPTELQGYTLIFHLCPCGGGEPTNWGDSTALLKAVTAGRPDSDIVSVKGRFLIEPTTETSVYNSGTVINQDTISTNLAANKIGTYNLTLIELIEVDGKTPVAPQPEPTSAAQPPTGNARRGSNAQTSNAVNAVKPIPTPSSDPSPTPNEPAPTPVLPGCGGDFNTTLVCLINNYRQENGLNRLTATGPLNQVALDHSQWMLANGNLTHIPDDGSTPDQRCAAAGVYCGYENVARASNPSAQLIFDVWRNSTGHNANLLRSGVSTIGTGIAGGYITAVIG